jgi:TorA maturation chaperone TorD
MATSDSLGSRAVLYELLARLYTYPFDEQVLGGVASLQLEGGPPELCEALGRMKMVATRGMEEVDALNVEATRLFEGPGKPVAPPYASYYLYGRLMGPPAIAANQFYLSKEALPESDGSVPSDHVAVELGFMAYMATRAEWAFAAGETRDARSALDASREFIDEYLLTWLPRFIEDVVRGDESGFFTGLVELTLASVNWDRQWLETLGAEHLEGESE